MEFVFIAGLNARWPLILHAKAHLFRSVGCHDAGHEDVRVVGAILSVCGRPEVEVLSWGSQPVQIWSRGDIRWRIQYSALYVAVGGVFGSPPENSNFNHVRVL